MNKRTRKSVYSASFSKLVAVASNRKTSEVTKERIADICFSVAMNQKCISMTDLKTGEFFGMTEMLASDHGFGIIEVVEILLRSGAKSMTPNKLAVASEVAR